jgi:hypothetical protein
MSKCWRSLLVLAVMVVLLSSLAYPQLGRSFWFTAKDDFAVTDSAYLIFGNWTGATFGFDSLSPTCKEVEAPPLPPSFDSRWVVPPGHGAASYGNGLLKINYLAPTSGTGRDTFVVRVYNGETAATDANVTMTWPGSTYLAARCDSMWLVDPTGSLGLGAHIDMFAQSSLVLTDPGGITGSLDFRFRIFVFGSHYPDDTPCVFTGISDTKTLSSLVPKSFGLRQNYPNPFNPSTTITFDIQNTAMTELSVYNILGQKIATLHSGVLAPGTYVTQWKGTADNGNVVPSGVYFVRMSAQGEHGQNFSGIRKLLLMK